MRGAARIVLAAIATVVLGTAAAAPASAGPPPPRQAVQVTGFTAYEYLKTCTDHQPPFTCGTQSTNVTFYFRIPLPPTTAQTLGYVIEDVSATAGADYTGATSGTVTIPTTANFAFVSLPVTNDLVAEGDETLRLRVTSSTFAGDVGQSAVATIRNDGSLPRACDLDRADWANVGLTCTNRPAGQTWRLRVTCGEGFTQTTVTGTTVTGAGRSAAYCPRPDHYGQYFFVTP